MARSGVRVKLVGRAPHVGAIARGGLLLDGLRVHERIPIAATTSIAEGVFDAGVILFCVKTVSTESAAREMQPFLAPNTTILSFQNGIDNPDRIHSAIRRHAVPAAVCVAAKMTAPGCVTHTGRGDLIIGHQAGRPRQPDLAPYVVRRGAALGIATPVSEILVAMVKLLEESALNRHSR